MLSFKRTVFIEFQFLLGITPVFLGGIIPPFAFAALKRNQFHNLFLARHILLLRPCFSSLSAHAPKVWSFKLSRRDRLKLQGKTRKVFPALEQNRTVDLILTMDMLCQLSYKGIFPLIIQGFVKIASW